jgi:hypothetical protein
MSELTAIDDGPATFVIDQETLMETYPAPRHTPPPRSIPSYAEGRKAQYLLLSGLLMLVPGAAFERHPHPATVLDLATGPRTSVWGWWSEPLEGGAPVPCLLWAGELGWSATTVEPDVFDTEGYECSFWSHRIKLLDLAVANATGPLPTLDELRQRVSADVDPDLGERSAAMAGALLWGILQQQAARTRLGDVVGDRSVPPTMIRGAVDDTLDRGHLGPDRVKVRLEQTDAGLAGLLRAVNQVRPEQGRMTRWLPGHTPWRRSEPAQQQSA